MNKKLIFVWMIVITNNVFASAQELFLRANQLYESREYQKALDIYASIAHKGPGTWFNMARCYSALGYNELAVAHFYRAQQSGTSWRLYAESARAIKEQIVSDVGVSTSLKNGFSSWVEYAISPFSLFFIQLIFVLFWFGMLWSLWYVRRWRTWVRGVVFLLFGVMLVCAIRVLMVKYEHQCLRHCMISKHVAIHAGPGDHYDVLGQLQKYDRVAIAGEHTNWYKIKTEYGAGWVPAVAVIVI